MTLQGEQPERGRLCAKEMREWEPLRVFPCNIPCLDVFKPVENNIKFTARAVYKLDDPWRENMLLEYFIFIFWLESKKFNRNKMVTKIAPECRRLVKQGR